MLAKKFFGSALVLCFVCVLIAKTYAACTRECHHFQYAVAEVTFNEQTDLWCLEFEDDTRGGSIYAFGSGLAAQDGRGLDDCTVHHSQYCQGNCSSFNPRVTDEPYDPENAFTALGPLEVFRYDCQTHIPYGN
jgi:hypothetical protein